ncbi:UNVERIFIED_CONTAM: Transcription factor GTE7 [Sesamum radiatum]|uniref:Transcription factor GTE7 n=1 Tax=Sesamum radiatum TaxID=300843 RepID=A0AAW2MV60_SESRA
MASAVLASQNDSGWGHMGKTPYSHPHLNANPNPNPKKKQKQFHHAAANGVVGRYHNNVDSPAVTQTASDDAYSFNQTSTSRNGVNYGGYLTFNVASYTKSELLELRKRLAAELDQIRDLRGRIESGQFNTVENPRSQAKSKKVTGNKRPVAVVGSVSKKISNGYQNGSLDGVNFEGLLKECIKIVAKLIKHKYGYVFKTPVDAVALGLHDYHMIVKRPMDLGTVKANLAKNMYPSPVEFAADVRLTFNNALLYNPKSDPVNGMAEQMLARFEELFRPIQEKIDKLAHRRREREFHEFRDNDEMQFRSVEELQGSSWNDHSNQINASPIRGKKAKPKASPVPVAQVFKKPDRVPAPMPAHSSASTPSNPPPPSTNPPPVLPEQFPASPVRTPALPAKEQKVGG